MPVRTKKENTPPPTDTKPEVKNTVTTSPLKIVVEKFLGSIKPKEISERMAKVEDQKVNCLYATFNSDAVAHEVALLFLQKGEEFGGTANELFCTGFNRSEPADDLILMFQFIPRELLELPIISKSPKKTVLAIMESAGVEDFDLEELAEDKTQKPPLPASVNVIFRDAKGAGRAAFEYLASDSTEEEKDAQVFCLGSVDEPLTLGFFSVGK